MPSKYFRDPISDGVMSGTPPSLAVNARISTSVERRCIRSDIGWGFTTRSQGMSVMGLGTTVRTWPCKFQVRKGALSAKYLPGMSTTPYPYVVFDPSCLLKILLRS